MKKLLLASIALALLPRVSRAQDVPQADAAVGYSQLLVVRGISLLMNGGSGGVALRPQAEYFGFRANGGMANTVHLSVGIVFRIGKKPQV
jgi:hypothetical protein